MVCSKAQKLTRIVKFPMNERQNIWQEKRHQELEEQIAVQALWKPTCGSVLKSNLKNTKNIHLLSQILSTTTNGYIK